MKLFKQDGCRWARHSCMSLPPVIEDSPTEKCRLAIFVSGGGSNLKSIHKACMDEQINGEVAVVVSNLPTCGGVLYAQAHEIPAVFFPKAKATPEIGLSKKQLISSLQALEIDFILLAGYLKLVPKEVVDAYPRKILNVHPALLPAFGGKGFYGMRVHKAVVASGARYSGPTVHFVDEEFDRGPILAQQAVCISPTDTPKIVARKVLQQEHKLYPECVAALCSGRVTWRADGVPIIWTPS